MAVITLRIDDRDDRLIREYAKINNITVSSLVREATLQKIEDEIDLKIYEKAMEEHLENPQAISFDEMMKEFNGNE